MQFNGQPSHSVDIEGLCQQYLGVEPKLVERYDRLQVKLMERVQSRIDQNNAPEAQVKRYAAQMSESRFPAPLVTSDGVPVDGNTRFKAYALRNTRYIECWVLPISWADADDDTKGKLLRLSLALNAMNGLPLDEEERLHYASLLIRDGVDDEEIVGKTGVVIQKVTALRETQRGADRMKRLGVDPDTLSLSPAAKRSFGKRAVMGLDDTIFKRLIGLAGDAALKGQQITQLASSIQLSNSPEAKQEFFDREAKALEPQILARRTGQKHPMQTWKLRNAFELLRQHPLTSFVEGNPEKMAEYLDLMDEAIVKLQELRALQASQPAVEAEAVESATAH